MKRARLLALVLVVAYGSAMGTAWSASGEEPQRLLYLHLLLDEDPNNSRLGARAIARLPTGATKQLLSDLVAEHFIALADPNPNLKPEVADTIGWHVNVLATNVGRYRSILNDARQRYGNLKVLKRIDIALMPSDAPSPDPAPEDEYKIRNVDFVAIKADLARQWAASGKRDRSQFATLRTGAGLETVWGALGSPDEVSSTAMRVAKYGRAQMLTLHYAGTGMVVFTLDKTNVHGWQAFEFVEESFDVNAVYIGPRFAMAQTLSGLRGSRFRDYVMFNKATIGQDPGFLLVLEQRLLTLSQPSDKFEMDGMAHCLVIIYRYGSLEAMDALRRIAKGSLPPNLQNVARDYATRLEQGSNAGAQSKKGTTDDRAKAEEDAA